MAGVKNINVVSGTGNPVQMQDLQNLWSVINTLCTAKSNSITVLAGMKTKTVGSETVFEAGIIFYNGQAYYLADSAAKPGQYLYVASQPSDQRVYEDGATRYMYTDYLVNVSSSATATGIGTLIGQATIANVAQWQTSYISPESITSALLQDNSVTTNKIANNAVTGSKIKPFSIGNDHIEDDSIIAFQKISMGSISQQNMGTLTVGTPQLIDKAVTGDKIADRTITGKNIMGGTIESSNIADETITNQEIAPSTIEASEKLAAQSITEELYATNSVSSRAIDGGAVQTNNIANDSVSYPKLAVGTPMRPNGKIFAPPTTAIEPRIGDFIVIIGATTSVDIEMPETTNLPDDRILAFEIVVVGSPTTIYFKSRTSAILYQLNIPSSAGGAHINCCIWDSVWNFVAVQTMPSSYNA